VADDIVREALTESNETPGSLDRGPSFQTLCGFPGFTKLEKVAYVSKAFRESFLLWVTIPSRSDGGYEIQVDREEPPLKKFKALFDQSGQGRGTDQTNEEIFDGDGSIPMTQLAVVSEEQEQEQEYGQTQARKRKADAIEADEGQRDVGANPQVAEGSSAFKKRAIEVMNANEPSQRPESLAAAKPSFHATTITKVGARGTNKGAAPGKPDTDPSFLRAIASTKRGKKTEDEFDREFNKLRIAKPDINHANVNADF